MQLWQVLNPACEYVPALQETHAFAEPFGIDPFAQFEQLDHEPDAHIVPDGQVDQLEDPAFEYCPAAHDVQLPEPADDEKLQ